MISTNGTPALLTLVFAIAGLTACGGNGDGPPTGPGNGNNNEPPPPAATTSVTVGAATFDPAAIVVSPGATVTWTWSGGGDNHNVTWASGNLTDSPTQASGTFQQTMPETTGELVYYCTLHGTPTGGMRGTVLVE